MINGLNGKMSSCKERSRLRKIVSIIILVYVFLYCFPTIKENMVMAIQRLIKFIYGDKN